MTSPDPAPSEPTPAAAAPDAAESRSTIAIALTVGGVVTIAIAIVLGLAVDPLLYLVALIGLADLVFARMFAAGLIGTARSDPAEAVALAEADPDYNPYARED